MFEWSMTVLTLGHEDVALSAVTPDNELSNFFGGRECLAKANE